VEFIPKALTDTREKSARGPEEQKLLQEWDDSKEEQESQWTKYPKEVQDTVSKIKEGGEEVEWERQFLGCVVHLGMLNLVFICNYYMKSSLLLSYMVSVRFTNMTM
jgi:hypothetical protein